MPGHRWLGGDPQVSGGGGGHLHASPLYCALLNLKAEVEVGVGK